MKTKDCEACGKVFERRETENYQRFDKRRACSVQCTVRLRSTEARSRFWDHVDKSGECWTWTRFRGPKGYGRAAFGNKQQLAHRVAFQLSNPEVQLTPDQFVCHKCDNPPCVRPDHLFLGDAVTNNQDKIEKGRAKYNNPPKGSRSAVAKFVESEVVEVRKIIDWFMRQGDIRWRACVKVAKVYNVDPTTLRAISARQTWKHV